MKSFNTLRARIKRSRKEIETIQKEVGKLRRELKAGTLDAKKLDAGLRKVQQRARFMPDHTPTFFSEIDDE